MSNPPTNTDVRKPFRFDPPGWMAAGRLPRFAAVALAAVVLPPAMLPAADPATAPARPPGAAVEAPRPTTAPAWPADAPAWVELDSIGDEVGLVKPAISLRADEFLRLLDLPQQAGRRPRPFDDWEKRLGRPVPIPTANWIVPADVRPPADAVTFHDVRRLSADRVVVMFLKPRGNYLWHHYYECLATFDVARGAELVAWLGLGPLQAAYTVTHRGIAHGSSAEAARKAFGDPDAVVHYQAMGFYQAYYFAADVGLHFQQDVVRRVVRGVPKSVKDAAARKGKALDPGDVVDDGPADPAGALPKAAAAIAAAQARTKDDPALKPLAAGAAREVGADVVEVNVETPDAWDGFPVKGGPPARGTGRVTIRAYKAARPADKAWTPFVPPPGCWVGRNWLDGPDGSAVMVYSQLADRGAHRRLVGIVVEEFGKAGVKLAAGAGEDADSRGQAKDGGGPPVPPAGGR